MTGFEPMLHAEFRTLVLFGIASLVFVQQAQVVPANDWPSWRGPHRSGIAVDETGL
ncbi:MAG: hypothetical protein ACI93T_004064, partial [Porticoccaceae bacterium]